jgi:hypothetical protein
MARIENHRLGEQVEIVRREIVVGRNRHDREIAQARMLARHSGHVRQLARLEESRDRDVALLRGGAEDFEHPLGIGQAGVALVGDNGSDVDQHVPQRICRSFRNGAPRRRQVDATQDGLVWGRSRIAP